MVDRKSALFTTRHYEFFADFMQRMRSETDSREERQFLDYVVEQLSEEFKRDNPLFKPDLFASRYTSR